MMLDDAAPASSGKGEDWLATQQASPGKSEMVRDSSSYVIGRKSDSQIALEREMGNELGASS